MADEKTSDLIKLTGLWEGETKNGDKYLSGTLGQARVFIFINKNRQAENHPTHQLFIAPSKPKEEGQGQQQQGQRSSGGAQRSTTTKRAPMGQAQGGGGDDDDIPF